MQSEGDINYSAQRKKWQQKQIDTTTQAVLEEDSRYFLKQSLSTPCLNVVEHCEGIWLSDMQGRRFMDFHGNNVHQVGFANPKVIEAIKKQLDTLSFSTRRYTNKTAIALAKKLASLAPGNLNKVLFAPGGTSAIGMALKLARRITGKHKTISMWDSFHGASLDAISVGGESLFRENIGPLMPGAQHVPPANPADCIWGCNNNCSLKCADYIDYIMQREGDVGAVICETVRSSAVFPSQEYWHRVREICNKHNALLILDEIPNGLGRTGHMFSCEAYGIVPDMLVLGKGLGGGVMPLAALITRNEYDIAGDIALGHYTHEKSPVACAAGLATIEFIEEKNLLQHVKELEKMAYKRLNRLKEQFPFISAVRIMGVMMGIELKADEHSGKAAHILAEEIMYKALDAGLSFKTTMGNILTLTPPLIITKKELEQAFDILEACFASYRTA